MKDYEHQDAPGGIAPAYESTAVRPSAPRKQKNTCGLRCLLF